MTDPVRKLDAVTTMFSCAHHALALAAIKRIILAQVPSRRVELAPRVIEELVLEHLIGANGQASLAAMNLAADILAVARPSANALQSSLAGIAHDEPDEPEARTSFAGLVGPKAWDLDWPWPG